MQREQIQIEKMTVLVGLKYENYSVFTDCKFEKVLNVRYIRLRIGKCTQVRRCCIQLCTTMVTTRENVVCQEERMSN